MSFKISKLQVRNFRNLYPDIIDFSPKINCILGENGNGKTNILEAVHFLCTRKSFRKNAGFPQFLGVDGDSPEIYLSSVFLDEDNNKKALSVKMEQSGNTWAVDGHVSKKRELHSCVFINPFDSYSFHTNTTFRRSWFDDHFCMLDKGYKKALSNFQSALKFRNALLSKKPYKFREQIPSIDRELAKSSVQLINYRQHFLSELVPLVSQSFREIFSAEHELVVELDSKWLGLTEEQIIIALSQGLEKDEILGHTKYAVHKDDYTLLFDGFNSLEFCSLGQQKMSYLSLIFAYIEQFKYKYNSFPIVLIDDVSGELDGHRWERLVAYLEKRQFQVLITTANEKFKEELDKIEGARKFTVAGGAIV